MIEKKYYWTIPLNNWFEQSIIYHIFEAIAAGAFFSPTVQACHIFQAIFGMMNSKLCDWKNTALF